MKIYDGIPSHGTKQGRMSTEILLTQQEVSFTSASFRCISSGSLI